MLPSLIIKACVFLLMVFQPLRPVDGEEIGFPGPHPLFSDTVHDVLHDSLQVTRSEAFYDGAHLLSSDADLVIIPKTEHPSDDWIVYVFILSLASIATARFFFPGRISLIIKAAVSLNHFSLAEKEGAIFHETPGLLLIVNFILVISLLTYQSLNGLGLPSKLPDVQPPLLYGLIIMFFSLFYLFKRLMMGFLAWVFQTRRGTAIYLSNIFVFNQFAGLAILPLVFLHAFNPTLYGLYAAWILIILVNLYKVVRGVTMGYRASGFSVYYLFLYLCGVELAPLLMIGKAANIYLFS